MGDLSIPNCLCNICMQTRCPKYVKEKGKLDLRLKRWDDSEVK